MAKKSDPTPVAPEPGPAQTPQHSGSVLDSLRHNRVGGLFAGLTVALAVGLLLSVLVPAEPNALALTLLGLFVALAVGFTVRYLSLDNGLAPQSVAFVSTVIGVHVMAVVGMVSGEVASIPGFGSIDVSVNDALVAAMATPALAVGPIVAGLIAVVIAGWGPHRTYPQAGTHQI